MNDVSADINKGLNDRNTVSTR